MVPGTITVYLCINWLYAAFFMTGIFMRYQVRTWYL